jgi:hypothetical protein
MKCITSDHSRQFGNIVGQSRCTERAIFDDFALSTPAASNLKQNSKFKYKNMKTIYTFYLPSQLI